MMKVVKKLLKSVVVSSLVICMSAMPVSAAEVDENKMVTSLEEIGLGEYAQYAVDDDSTIQPKAPAPALTSLKMYWLNSQKAGEEYVQQSSSSLQVGSKLDHGGTWFQAETIEIGYAKSRFAYFNGVRMTLTDSQGLDFNNDRIIDGYLCLWTYQGTEYETGTFESNSTSANSPWNTLNLRFYVY